jgi:P-type Cu2+ transporter
LQINDFVWIRPGERFPADGIVLHGMTDVEEALLSGESQPIPKKMGSKVYAGSINILSPIWIKIEQLGEATRLAQIARQVELGLQIKPDMITFADMIARYFVLILIFSDACSDFGCYFCSKSTKNTCS